MLAITPVPTALLTLKSSPRASYLVPSSSDGHPVFAGKASVDHLSAGAPFGQMTGLACCPALCYF